LKKCESKDEADDLFQEVALRFCVNARKLNNGVHIYPWLTTVLLHCHYSHYRKKDFGRTIPISSLCEPSVDYDGSEDCLFVLRDEKINPEAVMGEFSLLLEELNPLEKMIVELSVVGGLNVRELSRIIGLSKGSVVARRNSAFKKMHDKMIKQNEKLKVVIGRDATLREIIECAG